jgi:hypothetical protein
LDVYGGNLYLNPAETHLEWLTALQEVTEDRLEEFNTNQGLLMERVARLEEKLGIKLKKGLSCSSMEYHFFVKHIVQHLYPSSSAFRLGPIRPSTSTELVSSVSFASSIETERVWLIVETPAACRRPKVTTEGTVRVPSNITSSDLALAVSKLSDTARELWDVEKAQQRKCREVIGQVQWELGIQRVFRMGVVRHQDFLCSLSRLIEQSSMLGGKLSGHSLGIAGSGRFCSVADDGTLVVPHNWT